MASVSSVSTEVLADLYSVHGNVWKVGEACGLSGQIVHKKLTKAGLINKPRYLAEDEKAKIRTLYERGFVKGDGQFAELQRELGRARIVIERYARSLGLTTKRRPLSDDLSAERAATLLQSRLDNGHPRGNLGRKHTQETKARISDASKKQWASMTESEIAAKTLKMMRTKVERGNAVTPRPHASWKAGWREVGGRRIYFRSAWECNYARYLDWLKSHGQISDWEHEPCTFWFEGVRRGCVSYLPDFLVTENNGDQVYHEVKGWMDDRSRIKINRMAKYHPTIKLLVIDSKLYKSIKSQMQRVIADWE